MNYERKDDCENFTPVRIYNVEDLDDLRILCEGGIFATSTVNEGQCQLDLGIFVSLIYYFFVNSVIL